MRDFETVRDEFKEILETKFNNDVVKFVNSIGRMRKYKEEIIGLTSYAEEVYKPTKHAPKANNAYRIYCILNDIQTKEDVPKCVVCGKYCAFKGGATGFCKTCGNPYCYQKDPQINEKRQKTVIENYGSLKAGYHDTAKKTIQKKYNVDNASQLEFVKQKKIETSRKNYGTDYPWQSEKGREEQLKGVQDKYNVDNISQLEEVKQKKIETTLKHYGVENPSQSLEVKDKIFKANAKSYKTPSGKEVLYEGNEDIYLDYIFKEVPEEDVETQPDISIKYYDFENKQHFYFPDILIKSNNKYCVIELKGLDLLTAFESNTLRKIYYTKQMGYESYLVVYHKKELYKLELLNYKENLWDLEGLTGDKIDEVKNILENRVIKFNIK